MLIQVFDRGTGAGAGPVNYVLDLHDASKKLRIPPPEILAGDPARMEMLIDACGNKYKYVSGVIAFHSDDNPTRAQMLEEMAKFEAMAFAGLDREQYDILWVKHGNNEIHFITPRMELSTGKALNIAPPGYEQLFDAFRDVSNLEHGWADPADPERAQMFKVDKHVLKAGLADDWKQLIGEYLIQRIESGQVQNRADVLASLEEEGYEINRVGKDYISVRTEPDAKPIRLKGLMYGEGFEISFDRAAALRAELGIGGQSQGAAEEEDKRRRDLDSAASRERAAAARARLERLVAKRADYNQHRYCRPARGPDLGLGIEHGEDRGSAHGNERDLDRQSRRDEVELDRPTELGQSLDERSANRPGAGEVGIGHRQDAELLDSRGGGLTSPGDGGGNLVRDRIGATQRPDGEPGLGERENIHLNSEPRLDDVQARRSGSGLSLHLEKMKGFYERVTAGIGQRLRSAVEAVQSGFRAIGGANQQLVGAGADLGQAGDRFGGAFAGARLASDRLGRSGADLDGLAQILGREAGRLDLAIAAKRQAELVQNRSRGHGMGI